MLKSMPKQAYLADLQARNRRNREVVETTFLPLNEAQRSWQPAPGEWSVDQCFQHLMLGFELYVHNIIDALNKPEPAHTDGLFRPSWWARRLNEWQFNPETKVSTLNRNNPPAAYSPDVFFPLAGAAGAAGGDDRPGGTGWFYAEIFTGKRGIRQKAYVVRSNI
jgi:hypothetical protein